MGYELPPRLRRENLEYPGVEDPPPPGGLAYGVRVAVVALTQPAMLAYG